MASILCMDDGTLNVYMCVYVCGCEREKEREREREREIQIPAICNKILIWYKLAARPVVIPVMCTALAHHHIIYKYMNL